MANTKVQSEQIEDGSITADKLADGTIVAAELADNAVTTAKINADAVTGAKIADNAIDSEHYTDGSIDTAHIADSQITVAKMAANSVDSDQYVDGSIDTVHLGDLQVTTAKIANGNISTAKIADNAVTSAKIDTNIDIAGTFDVTGATTLDSTLSVAGTSTLATTAVVGSGSTPFATQRNVNTGGFAMIQGKMGDSASTTAGHVYSALVAGIEDNTNGAEDGYFAIEVSEGGSGDEKFRIKSDGNVGIGITSPATTLHLDASGGAVMRLQRTSANASNKLELSHDGTDGTITSTNDLILSATNVGIGTTSPNQLLEVANSNGGATINISTDQAAGRISSKKYTNLDFSGYNNNVNARIQSWDEASSTGYGYLTFHTNSGSNTLNEAMRIDRLGNVITTGYLKAEGQILGRTRSSNRGELMINGVGENDVSEIFFGYGDGYVGNDNNFRWGISDRGYTDGHLVFYSAPKTTGAGFVEVASFKGSDGAFRTTYGIRFGSDTAAANTLDDYEEGTWNPTLSNTSNVSNLVASDAKYRKIGNLVYINLVVQADVTSSTAETHIRVTLPITAESTQYADVGHVGFYQGTGADRFGVASLFRGTQSSGNTITDIYVAANQQVGTGTTYFRCSMVYKAA